MSYTIFGLYFLIQAILNASGNNIFLGKDYRNSERGKTSQNMMILPLTLLGSGWVFMGALYYALYEGKGSTSFYVWLGIITIIAFIIMIFNKYKFKKMYKSKKK